MFLPEMEIYPAGSKDMVQQVTRIILLRHIPKAEGCSRLFGKLWLMPVLLRVILLLSMPTEQVHEPMTALKQVVCKHWVLGKTACPVVSTKGATGHTLGAAGGIEAVLTLLALNKRETTGTIGCRTQDPDLGIAVLAEHEQTALIGRTGMSQSLAFGGSNAALILEGNGL